MHPYELKIMHFMRQVSTQSVTVSDKLIEPALKDIGHYMRKMYEEDPVREFSMRMSQIGRPLCQLQMQKAEAPALQDEWNNPLRMFFGGVIEATTVCILKAAGINIEAEQLEVSLPIKLKKGYRTDIKGTLDLIIDGKVWDVKSASAFMFTNKFSSYASLKANDDFGYCAQLYGYADAVDKPAGGWIVVDKSSGLIKILSIPDEEERDDKTHYIQVITDNVNAITESSEFKRCFSEVDETFKKRYTGNKYIESPCVFCKFRYTCWPTLQYLPNPSSQAFEKTYRHYTSIGEKSLDENPICEGEGQEAPKGSGIDTSAILSFINE